MWRKTASTYGASPPSISAAAAPRMICTVLTGKCGFILNWVSPCLAMKRRVSSCWYSSLFLMPLNWTMGAWLLVSLNTPPSSTGT